MVQNQGVFIFTRDLRLHDNLALNSCIKWSDKPVVTVFIFRKSQIGEQNEYRSDNAIEFMMESLRDLSTNIQNKGGKLHFIYEDDPKKPNKGLQKFIRNFDKPDTSIGIYTSRDVTPFSVYREKSMTKDLVSDKVSVTFIENHLLNNKSRDIVTGSGGIYTTFKPFYDRIISNGVMKPERLPHSRSTFSGSRMGDTVSLAEIETILPQARLSLARRVEGGETNGLIRLNDVRKKLVNYHTSRDILAEHTSYLSAYFHFGCVSIRYAYNQLEDVPGITREMIFREYSYHQLMSWEKTGWKDPRKVGESIPWKRDTTLENAWKNGRTGVPIVDAAMRQLRLEGYIHNRGRMIVANYLIKNMNIHWRVGEKYFAKWLTDYDWGANFMNWLQISSILPTDVYSRGMNPYIQAKKFDKDLRYIRKYVPELKDADPKDIFSQDRDYPIGEYPAPILNYKESKGEYLKWAEKYVKTFHPRDE